MANATHFLHIPIATKFSMSRIQDVLSRLARDPLAAALPPVAWLTARELHYSILPLHLKTQDRVQDAIQLLGSAEVRGIVNECANVTAMSSGSGPSPSIVTLHGLKPANVDSDDVNRTAQLCVWLENNTYNFSLLQHRLLHVFRKYIFTINGRSTPALHYSTPFIKIMTSKYMRTNILSTTPQWWRRKSQTPSYRAPLYDARDLCMKYKDHTWIKDLEVETLSIAKRALETSYEEAPVLARVFAKLPEFLFQGSPREC